MLRQCDEVKRRALAKDVRDRLQQFELCRRVAFAKQEEHRDLDPRSMLGAINAELSGRV